VCSRKYAERTARWRERKTELFEILDHPDVSALWPEAVKEHPFAVRGLHRIVDAAFSIGEFVYLFGPACCNRRYPEQA